MPLSEEQKRINNRIACKKYRLANLERRNHESKIYSKQWRIDNPMKVIISQWKCTHGIICDDYEVIYWIYVSTIDCNFCHKIFKDSLDRNLDHNHSITDSYNIRGILCRDCNTKDKLKGYDVMELD